MMKFIFFDSLFVVLWVIWVEKIGFFIFLRDKFCEGFFFIIEYYKVRSEGVG